MLAMLVLVGCGEDVIGEYIDQYDKPTEKELLTYNLYIVCGDETSEAAKTFVRQRISDYTEKSKLRTNLNVVFCSAAEYDSIIRTATDVNSSYDSNAELTDADKANKIPQADIFLITSAALMDDMVAANRVADLTTYFNGDYEYGKFNAQIATSLMSASIIANKNYAIPNNYVEATILIFLSTSIRLLLRLLTSARSIFRVRKREFSAPNTSGCLFQVSVRIL